MKPFFKPVLLSSLLSLFVLGELAMGQVFRNRLSRNRNQNVMVQPKDVYYEGVKLGIDTPINILEKALGAEPVITNKRTGDIDFTVSNAAKFYLGQCYLLGYNNCSKDEEIAATFFEELLDQISMGEKNISRWTGVPFAPSGRFQRVPPSFNDLMTKYLEDVRKKAEQGNAEEQIKLGGYYVLGMGVPIDPKESVKWIRRAAEQGNGKAQYTLATYYAEGYGGLPVSRTEFEKWLRRAAIQGDDIHGLVDYMDGKHSGLGLPPGPAPRSVQATPTANRPATDPQVIRQPLTGQNNAQNRPTYQFTPTPAEQAEIDQFLAVYGRDVNARDQHGTPILHLATTPRKFLPTTVYWDRLAIAKYFVSKGADVNAKDSGRFTVLFNASGDLELVKFLVSQGADVNAKSRYGETPLHRAASNGCVEVAKYLVSQGAKVNAKTREGLTPIGSAKELSFGTERNTAVIEYLKSVGAK